MDYIDQVADYLLKMKPGRVVRVDSAKNEEMFRKAVIDLIDDWCFGVFVEFSNDYKTVRRMRWNHFGPKTDQYWNKVQKALAILNQNENI